MNRLCILPLLALFLCPNLVCAEEICGTVTKVRSVDTSLSMVRLHDFEEETLGRFFFIENEGLSEQCQKKISTVGEFVCIKYISAPNPGSWEILGLTEPRMRVIQSCFNFGS